MKESLYQYLTTQTGALSLEDVVLNFLVALALGLLIYISYRTSHAGSVYSAKFNVSLVMLTIVTTLVMNVIGNNIALSLGMVGALSIVRFRTAIKDPRDTAYIFWCIAVGICCGVSEYMIAAVGSVLLFLFLFTFGNAQNNERFLLVVRGSRESGEKMEQAVQSHYNRQAKLRVRNTTEQEVELIFLLSESVMKKVKIDKPITDLLYEVKGVESVNLVCQNDEINR